MKEKTIAEDKTRKLKIKEERERKPGKKMSKANNDSLMNNVPNSSGDNNTCEYIPIRCLGK